MAATEREVCLTVECAEIQRDLLWISLQRDGSVSVGFLSQRVVASSFVSDSESLDLTRTRRPEEMDDPHFTLHEGAYFRLRSGRHRPLIEGLVWTTPEPGKAVSPWLRFTSNPIRELRPTREVVRPYPVDVLRLRADAEDRSVAIHIDFVARNDRPVILVGREVNKIVVWKEIALSVLAYDVPRQPATLGYRIEG